MDDLATELSAARALALELADGARSILRQRFRSLDGYEVKADSTPVTEADREVEAWMRRTIEERFPEHGIEGEEQPTVRGDAHMRWVLDPIDGTKSFATGRPLFVSLIALVQDDRPVLGVIEAPMTSERWIGQAGLATMYVNAENVEVEVATRAARDLSDAVLYSTNPDHFRGAEGLAFRRVADDVRYACYGGDGYLYGMLARGDIDLVIERGLAPYDVAALIPIVEGAGGVMCDWDGGTIPIGPDVAVVAASSRAVADAALARLRG